MAQRFWWQQNVVISTSLFLVLVCSGVVTQATALTETLTLNTSVVETNDDNDVSDVASDTDGLYTDDIFAIQQVIDSDYKIKKKEEEEKEAQRQAEAKKIADTGYTTTETYNGRFRLSTTSDSDEVIIRKINNYLSNTPLAGYAQTFLDAGKASNVDPYFIVAIAREESGAGTSPLARNNNNLFGRKAKGGGWASYSSKEAGIYNEASYLAQVYIDVGLTTISSIGAKYCEGGAWAGKIISHRNNLINS